MTPIKVHAPRATAAKKAPKALGTLPEWNLADLYSAMDAPEIKRDLDRGETECFEFEKAYKGRLADIAASADAGRTLGEAVRRYEAIEDVLGRTLAHYEEVVGDSLPDKAPMPLKVHRHTGQPCPRCGETLAAVFFKDPVTTYCPAAQTGGRVLKDRRLSRLLK